MRPAAMSFCRYLLSPILVGAARSRLVGDEVDRECALAIHMGLVDDM
jgi:hypothetical protein